MVRKAGIKKTVGEGRDVGGVALFTTCEESGEEMRGKISITNTKQKREWTQGAFPTPKGVLPSDESAGRRPFLATPS